MIYSIDALLAELGQELPLGNGERYRRPVLRYTRLALRKIGYDKVAATTVEPFDIRAHALDPMPEHILDVLDAGETADNMSGERFGQAGHSNSPYAFIPTPTGLQFPNLDRGQVYLKIQRLPVDERGNVVILEECYEAVFKFCLANLLGGFPLHPRFSERRALENDAAGLIDSTRAFYNRRGSLAQNRAHRKYL